MKELDKIGIMLSASLKEQIIMSQREAKLKAHPYRIFYASDGRWATHIQDEEKGRRLIKRKNKKDLEDAIVKWYEDNAITFMDVLHKWRKFHDRMVSDSSACKYDSDEIRYFKDETFSKMQIDILTSDDVEVFIKRKIDERKLCQSAAKTLYHYLDRVFEFAIRHGYISKSPMCFMQAKDFYKYVYPSKRSTREKLISEEKAAKLNDRYEADLKKHPENIALYGVIFSALTGMRVGEIAALRWDRIFDDYIVVDMSQKYNPKSKEYYISKTKNDKIRKFPLTDEIRKLLDRIKFVESGLGYLTEFVFSDGDGPVNFRKISSCIKNKCRQVGVETAGIHAYRRTVNSEMARDGVPVSIRAALLGHSREVNERYYTFDASNMEEKAAIVSKVNGRMR